MTAAVLAAACIVANQPTPALTWDHAPASANVVGYSLWAREPGQPFVRVYDMICQSIDDGSGNIVGRVCRGGTFPIPVQRAVSVEGFEVDFAVDAYNVFGRSPALSNVVRVCMPMIWDPGEVYQ